MTTRVLHAGIGAITEADVTLALTSPEDTLVVGFNVSTHQAENGIQQLRSAADGAGRDIEAQLDKSVALKDDLIFLTERGNRLADRLDTLVRAARPLMRERTEDKPPAAASSPSVTATTQVERELLAALRMAR